MKTRPLGLTESHEWSSFNTPVLRQWSSQHTPNRVCKCDHRPPFLFQVEGLRMRLAPISVWEVGVALCDHTPILYGRKGLAFWCCDTKIRNTGSMTTPIFLCGRRSVAPTLIIVRVLLQLQTLNITTMMSCNTLKNSGNTNHIIHYIPRSIQYTLETTSCVQVWGGECMQSCSVSVVFRKLEFDCCYNQQ